MARVHKQADRNQANLVLAQTELRKIRSEVDLHIQHLQKILTFRGFVTASIKPVVRDVEVIVCFSDIRGFTAYCKKLQEKSHDRKIQNFLQQFFTIYAEGMTEWRALWDIERRKGVVQPRTVAIEDFISPTMYKNLGDGMMIVWEVPSGLGRLVDGQFAREVLRVIEHIKARFYYHFRRLTGVERDSYSSLVETDLELGFAISRGHAWRLDFPGIVDYAGSVINLGSRLLDFARPKGLVVEYLSSQTWCDEEVSAGRGVLAEVRGLKGFDEAIAVWLSEDVNAKQRGVRAVGGRPSSPPQPQRRDGPGRGVPRPAAPRR